MRRGDIRLVDLEPVWGAEANKQRPAIIVSNDGEQHRVTPRTRGRHCRPHRVGRRLEGTSGAGPIDRRRTRRPTSRTNDRRAASRTRRGAQTPSVTRKEPLTWELPSQGFEAAPGIEPGYRALQARHLSLVIPAHGARTRPARTLRGAGEARANGELAGDEHRAGKRTDPERSDERGISRQHRREGSSVALPALRHRDGRRRRGTTTGAT
ncbi:MAG: type II toxin-antitoxin system PemK/MazF family toxin [Aeromicrobium sp.]